MADVRQGTLMLADIAGYTRYLGGVELEHCHDVLVKMLDLVSQQMAGVFEVAKFEGDAVFSYDRKDRCDAEKLVATIEACYFAFARFRREIEINRTCPCDACRQVPELDLKIVTHYGSFVEDQIGGSRELVGSDVVLAHRLLKNSVTERTGLRAYALFTTAALEHFGLGDSELQEHRESYESLGEIDSWVFDLAARWREEQDRVPVVVSPEESILTTGGEAHVPPAVVWDYLTSPEKKVQWRLLDKRIDTPSRRSTRGVGTVTHCVMKPPGGTAVERCLDWRPYRSCTFAQKGRLGEFMYTYELEPINGGQATRLSTRLRPVDRRFRVAWRLFGRQWRRFFEKCSDKLAELLAEESSTDQAVDSSPGFAHDRETSTPGR
jgi:uncharacterized protein YndB with AHSA1/START domain